MRTKGFAIDVAEKTTLKSINTWPLRLYVARVAIKMVYSYIGFEKRAFQLIFFYR